MQIFDISKEIDNKESLFQINSTDSKITKVLLSESLALAKTDKLLSKTIGLCQVVSLVGELGAEEISELFEKADCGIYHSSASEQVSDSFSRLLIKGQVSINKEGAKALVEYGVESVGIENNFFSKNKDIQDILFLKDILIIENLNLSNRQDGMYLLNASPLPMIDSQISPCRAVLIL